MRLATLVSPSDWMFNSGTAGKAGWRYILERLARVGITRVYWRVTTGASRYASKINNTGPVYNESAIRNITRRRRWWFYEALDWSKDDSFAVATEYGRRLGIEVHAWLTLENAHGGGSCTRLMQEHPELMTVDRCGKRYQRLHGWAFPEVRCWWLNIVRELVAYNPDGILLDFGRFGYMLDEHGVSTGGYETPAVEAFNQQTHRDPFEIPNNDPEWIQARADYLTQWIQSVRDLLDGQPRPMKLSLWLYPPGAGRNQNIAGLVDPTGPMSGDVWDLGEQKVLETESYVLYGPPLHSRFADVGSWSKKGWIELVTLVDSVARSDPTTWKPYVLRLAGGGRAVRWDDGQEGYPIRESTEEERARTLDYFRKLSDDKLKYSWLLMSEREPDELRKRILALQEQGLDEVNLDESNLLMHTLNDRWDAVEAAAKEIGVESGHFSPPERKERFGAHG